MILCYPIFAVIQIRLYEIAYLAFDICINKGVYKIFKIKKILE